MEITLLKEEIEEPVDHDALGFPTPNGGTQLTSRMGYSWASDGLPNS